uniref:Uncharacterized protein n=1 Tax=Anopheles atroparvus TaxID=41427 RepID=A0AAG5D0G3_ANOAO
MEGMEVTTLRTGLFHFKLYGTVPCCCRLGAVLDAVGCWYLLRSPSFPSSRESTNPPIHPSVS